jgi:hypothetical protein
MVWWVTIRAEIRKMWWVIGGWKMHVICYDFKVFTRSQKEKRGGSYVGEKKRGGWPALVGCVIPATYKDPSDSDFGCFWPVFA